MGNVVRSCTDSRGESTKSPAFASSGDNESALTNELYHQRPSDRPNKNVDSSNVNESDEKERQRQQQKQQHLIEAEEEERQRLLLEEQARLELIVSMAGRSMVGTNHSGSRYSASLHASGHGGGMGNKTLGYYDPGYAATVAQELLQNYQNTTGGFRSLFSDMEALDPEEKERRINMVGGRVPFSCVEDSSSALEIMGKTAIGAAVEGLEGKRLEILLDDCAESFLRTVLVARESLFQGIGAIVENLP